MKGLGYPTGAKGLVHKSPDKKYHADGGIVCWWTIEAQGRVVLATGIDVCGGWLLNVPMAAAATFVFHFGIAGLVLRTGIYIRQTHTQTHTDTLAHTPPALRQHCSSV